MEKEVEVMFNEWYIVNWIDTEEHLFWHHETGSGEHSFTGWGSFENATIFSNKDMSNYGLPFEGVWVPKIHADYLIGNGE
jgi:hypothetical protein